MNDTSKKIEKGDTYERRPNRGAQTWPNHIEVMDVDDVGYVTFKEMGGSDRFPFKVHRAVFQETFKPYSGEDESTGGDPDPNGDPDGTGGDPDDLIE